MSAHYRAGGIRAQMRGHGPLSCRRDVCWDAGTWPTTVREGCGSDAGTWPTTMQDTRMQGDENIVCHSYNFLSSLVGATHQNVVYFKTFVCGNIILIGKGYLLSNRRTSHLCEILIFFLIS